MLEKTSSEVANDAVGTAEFSSDLWSENTFLLSPIR